MSDCEYMRIWSFSGQIINVLYTGRYGRTYHRIFRRRTVEVRLGGKTVAEQYIVEREDGPATVEASVATTVVWQAYAPKDNM